MVKFTKYIILREKSNLEDYSNSVQLLIHFIILTLSFNSLKILKFINEIPQK